jgi:LSD1 subclass zinc finger protein
VAITWLLMQGLLTGQQPGSEPIQPLFLHCPECGLEIPCPPSKKGMQTFCPQCGLKRIVMEQTTYRHASLWRFSDFLTASIFATAAVLALALLAIRIRRRQRGADAKGEVYCDACRRKVRYSLASGGERVPCPYCQAKLHLPGEAAKKPRQDAKVVKSWGAALRRQRDVRRGRVDPA